jgi:hypothetical protein
MALEPAEERSVVASDVHDQIVRPQTVTFDNGVAQVIEVGLQRV